MISPFLRVFSSLQEAEQVLERMQIERTGIKLMAPKMFVITVAIRAMDMRALNILKQEALSLGADTALPKTAAAFKNPTEDAVLFGTVRQLTMLIAKLAVQPFGLAEFGRQLKTLLDLWQQDTFSLSFPRKNIVIQKPLLMGILNVTPDSFSDGGKFAHLDAAVAQARQMISDGVDILDIGGESTGPGSKDVSLEEEKKRIFPVVKAVRDFSKDVLISIDTWKSEVAAEAIRLGADMVNDVTALRGDAAMAKVCADAKVPMCLMYAKDSSPRTTREAVQYDDVLATILAFLQERILYAKEQGILEDHLIVDPGMGAFVSGESKYSFEVIRRLRELKSLGRPVLISPSKKSYLGGTLEERAEGSLAMCAASVMNGAQIIRMHDVQGARRVIDATFQV